MFLANSAVLQSPWFLAVYRQLNRWPCHWSLITHSFTDHWDIFWFLTLKSKRETLETFLTYLTDLPTCPTYLTYLPDLPTWPTYLTYLPDLSVWPTYLPDLPTWPTYLIYLPTYKHTYQPDLFSLWHLRHWLQFWQLRTWIHDNLCYPTIKSDSGQRSQFLQRFLQQ